MAIKQFLNSSIKWVPQPGFSVVYTENGGIEAAQDILIRTADISTITGFNRGTRWEIIFPEVPTIYRGLTMKTFDPTDRGDGFTILKCTFTGYQFVAPGSSGVGDEAVQATSTLTGQLTAEPLSSHPKWASIDTADLDALCQLLNGSWTIKETIGNEFAVIDQKGEELYYTPSNDTALMFAKIIQGGDQTWDRGGWTYSYHTESETGFTSAQLNSLGKIVANPPGNPQDPGAGWTWMLASPSQSQSGLDRFIKTLDFRLIQDNDKNQFLYDY
jgi:hypothetical protein